MLNDENWRIAIISVRIWVSLNPGEFRLFPTFSVSLLLREPFDMDLGQFYWFIGSHDTIHLKMALKTILIFLGKSKVFDFR